MSKYVYRRDDDVPARPNANHNVIGLGVTVDRSGLETPCPSWGCGGPPTRLQFWEPPPNKIQVFPGYGSNPPTRLPFWGAVNTTPQLPPGQMPGSVTPNNAPLPVSPAPAPTVQVPASQTGLSLSTPGTTLSASGNSPGAWTPNQYYAVGQAVVDPAGHTQQVLVAGISGPSAPNFNDMGGNTVDGSVTWNDMGAGGAASSGIGTWLAQSTLISGIPNWGIAGVGILLLMTMSKRR